MPKAVAILLAAGRSRRFGRDKLWLKLGHRPVVVHTIAAFQRCRDVNGIILVASSDKKPLFAKLKAQNSKLNAVVGGGPERQFSVYRGLLALPADADLVVIHDAARPCVPPQLISQTITAARRHGAAIAACPIADTIKEIQNPHSPTPHPLIRRTLDRARLWTAQTPQSFRSDLILRAYTHVITKKLHVTDDAAAVELLGHPVRIVPSDSTNLKITRPADLDLARQILWRKERHATSGRSFRHTQRSPSH